MRKANKKGRGRWWLPVFFFIGCTVLLYGGYHLFKKSIEQAVYTTTVSFMEQLADHDQLNVTSQMNSKWEELGSVLERIKSSKNSTAEGMLYELGVESKTNSFEELYLIMTDGSVLGSSYLESQLENMPWGGDYKKASDNFVIRYSESSRERWGEYLIYGINLDNPISCGTRRVSGLVGLVPISEISSQMRMESFDGRGIAIVMSPDGKIITASQNYSSGADTQNFLKELEKAEFRDGGSVETCREDVKKGEKLFVRYQLEEEDFYALFQPLNDHASNGWYLVVRVTGQVTSEQVRSLIMRSVPFFFILGILMLPIVYIIYHSMNEARIARASEQAKSAFFANMSHEIRTPLNGIIGLQYLMRQNIDDKEKLKEYLTKSEISAEFLKSVITDVLDMSKIESGQLDIYDREMNLSEAVKEIQIVLETQAEKKGLHFCVDCQNLIYPYVLGDAVRVKQILTNLLGNALKFTPENGTVSLTVVQKESKGTACTTFYVADTGSGMSQEFLEKIWEPFEQEKRLASQNGTGLGTTLSKTLAEKMNGSISVESRLGEGTTFTVEIPFRIIQAPQISVKSNEGGKEWDFRGKHVLMAEDNDINRMIAVSVMQEVGCIVTEAVNGQEAVEAFQKSRPYYFDLIFMDIQMPVMDGYEAARTIRSLDREDSKSVVIFALTANAFREDVDRALECGMDDVATKPMDVPLLLEKVKEIKNRED